jgi:capsular polysaccharide transport system permease protein
MINTKQLKHFPIPARLFLCCVIFPTFLITFYYTFIASDIYISEAKYSLRLNSDSPSMGLIDSFMSGSSGIEFSNEDASIVMEYIHSRDIILELDKRLNILEHYSSSKIDFISRFSSDNSLEDFLEYFISMVEVNTDGTSHVSTLNVRAFSPELAKLIAENIINLSENLVNNMSNRIIEDSLQFSRNEVNIAELRVRNASDALTKFRNETKSINPGQETTAVLHIISGLEAQLAEARTLLIETQSYMQNESTQIKVLKGKVLALQQQVNEERKRLNNNQNDNSDFTHLIDNFEPLVLEKELATKQYASTLTSLEFARIDAQKKQRYLMPFVPPHLPDDSVEPNRIHSILTWFLSLCVIYAIGGLVWAAIKDHMRL